MTETFVNEPANANRLDGLKEIARVGKTVLKQICKTFVKTNIVYTPVVPEHALTGEVCPHEQHRLEKLNELKNIATIHKNRIYAIENGLVDSNKYNLEAVVESYEEILKEIAFYNSPLRVCRKFCKHVPYNGEEHVPNNLITYTETEQNTYTRLSKLQIKQYLLYHFMHVCNHGIIKDIKAQEVASYLGCDVRSVHLNNKILSDLDLIGFSNTGKSDFSFHVIIKGYSQIHKTVEEGGHGYLSMTQSFLAELLKVSNINGVRNALFLLLKTDNDKANLKRDRSMGSLIQLSSLKEITPTYLHAPHKIQEGLSHVPDVFEKKIINNVVEVTLLEEYRGSEMREKQMKKRAEKFNVLVSQLSDLRGLDKMLGTPAFEVEEKQLLDLAQLSIEYGEQTVEQAVHTAFEHYFEPLRYHQYIERFKRREDLVEMYGEEFLEELRVGMAKAHGIIANLGGLVRQIIRNTIKEKKAS